MTHIIRSLKFKKYRDVPEEGKTIYWNLDGVFVSFPMGNESEVFYDDEYVKHLKAPLNERIRRFREIKKWTQSDLAKRAGVTQGEISAIECGSSRPGIAVINKLQKAFKLDFHFFA
jgi:DNA-binding XRE family transcriptional regulator